MNLRNLLKHRNIIYGILALWIIVFHVNRRLGEPIQIPILKQLVQLGNMGVDIFVFFSGCCLYLSMEKNPDIKRFYKRRVMKLIPSYLIISIPFWLWRSFVEAPKADGGFHFVRFIADISSVSFWVSGVETTWFVFAIFVFYLLFPYIYKVVNKSWKLSLGLLSIVYAMNIIGIQLIPIFDKSSIAWTRLPIFIIGVIAGKYIEKIDLSGLESTTRKVLLIFLGSILAVFLFLFPIGTLIDGVRIPSEYLWLSYSLFTSIVVVLLIALFGKKKVDGRSNLLKYIGEMSLEMYVSHITILHIFTYYNLLVKIGEWTFAVLIAISILLSSVVHYIIINRIIMRQRVV